MSEIKIYEVEVCPECGHGISQHFQAVNGMVRCLAKTGGVTSVGVPGMFYETSCDCTDYNSNEKAERELRKKKYPPKSDIEGGPTA